MRGRNLGTLQVASSLAWAICVFLAGVELTGQEVEFSSPGLPPSKMDAAGRLVEDWGSVELQVDGSTLAEASPKVFPTMLDDCIPAALAQVDRGPIRVTWFAYRAPIFPSGVDVLTVRLEAAGRDPVPAWVKLRLSAEAKMALTTARIGNRVVLSVPLETFAHVQTRDWGYVNETTAMPGWAKPEGPADPAYANIRAGMGGVPILYRFRVEPGSQAVVILGICESHYDRAGIRPVLYEVEGARPEVVDPIARWGRHRPGALPFRARDVNGDGQIEVAARPLPAARDRNPILNVIWVFQGNKIPTLPRLISGEVSQTAWRYVDVGGQNDQSFYLGGPLEFPVMVPATGSRQLTFLVACPGSSAPVPESTAWTADSLRQAARDVWLAWSR